MYVCIYVCMYVYIAGQIVQCDGGDIGPISVFSDFVGFESQVSTRTARSSRYDI